MKRDASGQPYRMFGTVQDITDRKGAEDKIREQESELRQILDLAPQQVRVYGPGGERLYANRIALDYYSVSLEEWRQTPGNAFRSSLFVHPDDRERAARDFDANRSSGSAYESEARVRGADGNYRWFLVRHNPLHDDKGQVKRWYVALTDIDERRRAEERLQQENVALREEIDKASMFEEIVGTSPALKSTLSRISKVAPAIMSAGDSTFPYALGSTDTEHERLIRQAVYLAPLTERLFREAGIGPGQRVLDLGSGVGDVAMLAAKLVGPSGEVVGVERDSRSIVRANARVSAAGLTNVSFTESDVSEVRTSKPFDAAVGRFILQFVSDPVAVLRCLCRLIRPGGVLVFQEVSYAPFLAVSARLPLWSATATLIHQILCCSGAKTEIGIELNQVFQEAALLPPAMRIEMLLGSDPDFTRWTHDLLCSLLPHIQRQNLSLERIGDFSTLRERIQAEVTALKTVVPFVALVGAWSRKPTSKASL